MRNPISIGIIFLLVSSCGDILDPTSFSESRDNLFIGTYNDDQIQSEGFDINPDRDTLIICERGTKIRLYANSFQTASGDDISLNIDLEVKEVFDPADFVLGNLTTTSGSEILMSGGMIYVNATSNGEQLILKDKSEIGVIVPTATLDPEMMIFQGERSNSMMNWQQPEQLLNTQLRTLEQAFIVITYQYSGGDIDTNNVEFSEWLWKAQRKVGDEITISEIDIKVVDISRDIVSLEESTNGLFIPEVITTKGQNGFVEDYNSSYIFSLKKLGWANIDKLLDDPNAEDVNMLVQAENHGEFDYVFTSLILPQYNIYIPGYEKRNETYGFSQNDSESTILPIGAKAFVMATAYKGDRPFFAIEELMIKSNMTVSLQLLETTPEGLKKQIEENI